MSAVTLIEEPGRECLCRRYLLTNRCLLITVCFLLIFLVDVEDGAVFVEGYIEGFGFLD